MEVPLLVVISLLACSGGADTAAVDTSGDGGFDGLTAALSDAIPAVFEVTWMRDGAVGAVAWGVGDEQRGVVTAEDLGGGAWRALVVGAPAEETVWFRATDGDAESAKQTIETGEAPGWVPDVTAQSGAGDQGWLALGIVNPDDDKGPVILDRDGRPVWWALLGGDDLYTTRVALDPAGGGLYANGFSLLAGGAESTIGIYRFSLDGALTEVIALPDHHHDFWLHDDGSIAYIAFDPREIDGHTIYGDRIVLRDPAGAESTLWSIWDHLSFTPGVSPEGPEGYWTVMNSLEFDAAAGSYWVSIRNLNTLLEIDAATGALRRGLGEYGDTSASVPFDSQHGFDVDGDAILLFDNGSLSQSASQVLSLDASTGDVRWSWSADPPVYAFYQGDALRLPTGNALIIWSTESRIDEVDPTTDAVVRSLSFEEGAVLTFARRLDRIVP